MNTLKDFLIESNKIEGITKLPTIDQIQKATQFLALETITVRDVANIVTTFQPNAQIRSVHGLNIYIGNHVPQIGGPEIPIALENILFGIYPRPNIYSNMYSEIQELAYNIHLQYEDLHPFTDGNGRSGRMIWLYIMGGFQWLERTTIGFLHTWYYQSLSVQHTLKFSQMRDSKRK